MAKKMINEYAIRSPDKRVYQGQMRRRYVGNLKRKRYVKKFPEKAKNFTDAADIQDENGARGDNDDNVSAYAEGYIKEVAGKTVTYSRDKAVATGRKLVSKRAEEKGARRHTGGRSEENSKSGMTLNANKNSSISHARNNSRIAKNKGAFAQKGSTYSSVESGRRMVSEKISASTTRRRIVGNSAVKGVDSTNKSIITPLKRIFEGTKNQVGTLAIPLVGGVGVIVIISIILVMTLTITSSFGEYNLEPSGNDLVNIAMTQVGNTSGEEYWTWYGFDHEVGWCACFVSWCGNQVGLIQQDLMPCFAWVPTGVYWFQSRNQWYDNTITPEPGMIIFFDWYDETLDENGEPIGQDGEADHVGIVEKIQDGYIYTVEGNTTEEGICTEKRYTNGYFEILGYGLIIM